MIVVFELVLRPTQHKVGGSDIVLFLEGAVYPRKKRDSVNKAAAVLKPFVCLAFKNPARQLGIS